MVPVPNGTLYSTWRTLFKTDSGRLFHCRERVLDDVATAQIDAAMVAVRDGGGVSLEPVGVVYRAAPAVLQDKRSEPT